MDAGVVAEAVSGLQPLLRLPGAGGGFHAIDVGCGENRLSIHCAAVEIEREIGGHVIRRGVDGAGGTLEDVPVGIRSFAVVVIEGSELRGWLFEIRCRLHAEGQKEILSDVVFEAPARELFDDVRGDGRSGVAIGHAGSGRPAGDARVMVVVEALAERHAFGVLGVLGQMQVVPSGGVLEQVDDTDRIGGLPAVLEPDLGDEFVDRVVEREPAFIDQFEDGERDESLGCGTDAEEGGGSGGLICCDVRLAESVNPLRLIAANDGNGHAGCVGVMKDLIELLTQLGNGLRRLGFGLGFLLRDGR
jgi:hypothetical protein